MRCTLGARDFSSAVSGFCQVFIAEDMLACVERERGRENLDAQERVGRAREKGKEPSSLARGLAP